MAKAENSAQLDISVVIVNRNGAHLLPRCLAALEQDAGAPKIEVIVVDNASTDGSMELPCLRGAGVRTIPLDRNVGFARGNNIGVAAAGGRYYLLLNTDCFVRPGLLRALMAELESHPGCAVAGPRLLNADGSLQPSCHNFPAPLVFFLEQSSLWKPLRLVPGARDRLHIANSHALRREVDWLAGACLMVRPKAYAEVGGFEESFAFYWEETDLCMRLRKRGWEIVFNPAAEAIHLGGGSSIAPALLARFFRSLYLFYSRHYTRRQLMITRTLVKLMALFKAARAQLAALAPRRAGERSSPGSAGQWLRVARL